MHLIEVHLLKTHGPEMVSLDAVASIKTKEDKSDSLLLLPFFTGSDLDVFAFVCLSLLSVTNVHVKL